jgi:hypothetical protein
LRFDEVFRTRLRRGEEHLGAFHVVAIDGVYAEQPEGSLLFHPLPAPTANRRGRRTNSLPQLRWSLEYRFAPRRR